MRVHSSAATRAEVGGSNQFRVKSALARIGGVAGANYVGRPPCDQRVRRCSGAPPVAGLAGAAGDLRTIEPALQHQRIVAALHQDEGGRGAASTRIAVGDVALAAVERCELQTDEVERNVGRALDGEILML